MSEKWLNFPSLSELFRYGPVPSVLIYMGLFVASTGVFWEISLSNRRLLLGAFLFCFGVMWYYLEQILDWYDDDEGRTRWTVSKLDLGACVFFLLLSFLSGYVLLSGHLPSWFPN